MKVGDVVLKMFIVLWVDRDRAEHLTCQNTCLLFRYDGIIELANAALVDMANRIMLRQSGRTSE